MIGMTTAEVQALVWLEWTVGFVVVVLILAIARVRHAYWVSKDSTVEIRVSRDEWRDRANTLQETVDSLSADVRKLRAVVGEGLEDVLR